MHTSVSVYPLDACHAFTVCTKYTSSITVNACNYHIELQLLRAYLAYYKQGMLLKNAIQSGQGSSINDVTQIQTIFDPAPSPNRHPLTHLLIGCKNSSVVITFLTSTLKGVTSLTEGTNVIIIFSITRMPMSAKLIFSL